MDGGVYRTQKSNIQLREPVTEIKSCTNFGWILLVSALVIITAIVLFFFFRQRIQLIEPDKCPSISTDYGVIPSKTADPVMSCGNLSNQECTFSPLTLGESISKCNQDFGKCSQFAYNSGTKTMTYTIPTSENKPSSSTDLYILQN